MGYGWGLRTSDISELEIQMQEIQKHNQNRITTVNFWQALKGMVKSTTAGTTLQTRFEAKGKVPILPPAWQENLLHIGQEALSNTLKYARAKQFRTRLTANAKELRLELCDDGDGFKVRDQHDGVGLAGMRERVQEMGGELKIVSSRGRGTKITVILPQDADRRPAEATSDTYRLQGMKLAL